MESVRDGLQRLSPLGDRLWKDTGRMAWSHPAMAEGKSKPWRVEFKVGSLPAGSLDHAASSVSGRHGERPSFSPRRHRLALAFGVPDRRLKPKPEGKAAQKIANRFDYHSGKPQPAADARIIDTSVDRSRVGDRG